MGVEQVQIINSLLPFPLLDKPHTILGIVVTVW